MISQHFLWDPFKILRNSILCPDELESGIKVILIDEYLYTPTYRVLLHSR